MLFVSKLKVYLFVVLISSFFFVVHINIQHENEENLDQFAIVCLLFIVISVFTKDNLRDRGLKKKAKLS